MSNTLARPSSASGASLQAWFLSGFLAVAVGLSVSLLNVLLFHSYPVFTPEVGILLLLFFGVALVFGMALAWRARGRAVLGGVLALVLADLALESLWVPVVVGIVGGVVAARMGVAFFRFVAVVFAVIGVTGALGLAEVRERVVETPGDVVAAAYEHERPLLVHLILDEFEGVRGLDALPGQAGAGEAVADALQGRGFTVYADAYSPYYRSKESLPAFLGGADWIGALNARGYDVSVVQSSFLDLCEGEWVAACRTYWRENLNGLREAGLSTGDRARLLLVHLARQSVVALAGSAVAESVAKGEVSTHAPLKHEGEANGINSLRELARLEEVVAGMGEGDALVAHVLAPHFPYAHDEKCAVQPVARWRTPWDDVPVEERASAYAAQVQCVTGLVERIAAAADAASGGRYVMIVQGDHGSRIGRELDDGELALASDEDLLHAASTLFAVRLANPMPGIMRGPASLGELLAATEAGAAEVPHEPVGDAPQMVEPIDESAPITLDWE